MRGNELLDKMELVDSMLIEAADGASVSETQGWAKSSGAEEVSVPQMQDWAKSAKSSGVEEVFVPETQGRAESGGTDGASTHGIRRWKKWVAAVACLCLLGVGGYVAVSFGIFLTGQGSGGDIGSAQGQSGDKNAAAVDSEDGVTIPPMQVTLGKKEGEEADMVAFFIYGGRCYVADGYVLMQDTGNLVGAYLGTSRGLIDEWTPRDGYVDYAGSVGGDFYEVKSYDPSFMLCMKWSENEIMPFICNTGITLKYGSELYGDRLHLAGNYRAVEYETRESWYYSEGKVHLFDENDSAVRDFVRAMNEAEVLLWERVVEGEGHTMNSIIYDTEIYHVYFVMNDGMRVHLRLYEGGYVRYQGILDVCVQVPQEVFEKFVSLLSVSD